MDSVTTLSVSSVVTLGLYSLTAINGTLGLLSSAVLDVDAELNVSKPPQHVLWNIVFDSGQHAPWPNRGCGAKG